MPPAPPVREPLEVEPGAGAVRRYRVTWTGKTPLLMHRDSVEWADEMERWKPQPRNKAVSKAGDDRTPAYRWLGCLYHDGTHIVVPRDNIMTAIRDGASLVPTGRRGATYRSPSQSGWVADPLPAGLPGRGAPAAAVLLGGGAPVPIAPFFDPKLTATFDGFQELAAAHGFQLHVKRARVGQTKHIRVRPLFPEWAVTFDALVADRTINARTLAEICDQAGSYKGLCEWRPGSKPPGAYGTFTGRVDERE